MNVPSHVVQADRLLLMLPRLRLGALSHRVARLCGLLKAEEQDSDQPHRVHSICDATPDRYDKLKAGCQVYPDQPACVLPGGGEDRENDYCCGALAVCAAFSSAMFVIRRTSTRRFSARPLAVLFGSAGLSSPSPMT